MTTTGPEPNTHKTLNDALLAAQIESRGFYKDAVNEFHKFTYASSDSVVAQARDVLHKHGLTASIIQGPRIDIIPGEPLRATISITIRLRHPATAAYEDTRRMAFAEPGKGRPLDKAIVGAETTLLRDYLRGLLFVPRTDDDMNGRDDGKYNPDQLGDWADTWLRPECERLGLTQDQLRKAMLRKGKDKAIIDNKIRHWPIAWKAEIKDGLAQYAASKGEEIAPDGDDAADLPQRPPASTDAQVRSVTRAGSVPPGDGPPQETAPSTAKRNGKAHAGSTAKVSIGQDDIRF